MRQASKRIPESAEKTVRDIRRATRRHHSVEEKIRIVLEGLRGEVSNAELCRKEGINQNHIEPVRACLEGIDRNVRVKAAELLMPKHSAHRHPCPRGMARRPASARGGTLAACSHG